MWTTGAAVDNLVEEARGCRCPAVALNRGPEATADRRRGTGETGGFTGEPVRFLDVGWCGHRRVSWS